MKVLWSLLAVTALALPSVAAQAGFQNPTDPTPVDLYFHLYGFQEFPINTQPPRDDVGQDAAIGITAHTASCLPAAPYTGGDYHTLYGFSSPSYVEYNDAEFGKPRHHPERELSYDVEFDTATPPVLHWYLSTWTGLPPVLGQDPNDAPLIVPQVRVRATLRIAGEVGLGPEGYDAGTTFAQGESEPAILAGGSTQGATATTVNGTPVYEIQVPLAFASDGRMPAATGFTLQVDTYVDNPACDPETGHTMPNLVRVHSSKDHRPRLGVTVTNPLRIEYVHPQVLGDGLAVHVAINSPFGSYDVDEEQVTLAIDGPTPATSVELATYTQHTHSHERHDEAADFAFLWQFRKDSAAPGNYTVTATARNDQGTATATAASLMTLGKEITVTGCGSPEEGDVETCTTEHVDGLGNPVDGGRASAAPGLLVAVLLVALAARRKP